MTKDRLGKLFNGFDSIDERMERVPLDLSDDDIREAVNGTVTAKEVIVSTEGWPDYQMGISVKAAAGYFGNARLSVPPQTVSSMNKALKNAGIPVRAREVAKNLTFAEAKIVIELIKKAGSEDEKTELTRKLQGISDR